MQSFLVPKTLLCNDMAIRTRNNRAAQYQVYWNNPYTGKRESKSFEDHEKALAFDSLVQHRLRFEKESFKPDAVIENGSVLTLEDATYLYLNEKRFPPKDTEKFLSAMSSIFRHIGHMALAEITADDIERVQKLMRHERSSRHKKITKSRYSEKTCEKNESEIPLISESTVHNRMAKLRTVIRWAAASGMIAAVPTMKLGAPSYKKFRPPTPQEADAIYAVAAPHVRRAILLGGTEGLRVGESELFALRWDHVFLVNDDDSYILIDTSRKNKNQPMRSVPIQEELVPMMLQWLAEDDAQGIEYVISYKGHPIQSIKTAWRATLRRAGLTRYFRPYDLRHAFATNLIAAGSDYGTVAELMGNSVQIVARHYQYVSTPQKRRAMSTLPFPTNAT